MILPRNATLCSIVELVTCLLDLRKIEPYIHGFLEIYTSDLVDRISGNTLSSILAGLINASFDEIADKTLPTSYAVISLGSFIPTSINERGDVAGRCEGFACIYGFNVANGISSTREVVGAYQTEPYVGQHAFLASGGGPLLDLAPQLTTIGNGHSEAVAISDNGFIAGNAFASTGEHAFLLNNGKAYDLATLPLRTFSIATDVNRDGTVVGYSYNPGGVLDAFVYSFAEGAMDQIKQLAALTNTTGSSRAVAVNDSALVVGIWRPDRSSTNWYGFAYRRGADTSAESFEDIQDSSNPGGSVLVSGVNNFGHIIGSKTSGAFVYQNRTLYDLNRMIPQNSGWSLRDAVAINNLGQIVGTGVVNGQSQAFLLTPVR